MNNPQSSYVRTSIQNDIVFVFPPAKGRVGSFSDHLGVGYLRSSLAESGIRSSQYLNPNPGTVSDITRDLLELKPGIIGFTAYDANFDLCVSIAKNIKQQQPCIKIVFGGPSVTFGAENLLARHEAIDLCMLGESEETAPHIFGNLLNGIPPKEDQVGVAFRRDGKVVCTEDPPLVGGGATSMLSSLDSTLSPYLSGMLQDGRTGLLTGRGCTHQCQYCCFAALGRRKLRLHSLERVLTELEFIAAHQQRTGDRYIVAVQDDTFTLLSARAKRLCEMVIDSGLKLTLSCTTRADAIDDELLKLMRAAGFVSLAFGLESAVPSVLRATGKVRPPDWPNPDLTPEQHFLEQVRKSVILAKELGFTVGVSAILGLPTETASDGETTLRFIKTLPIDYYAHNFLNLYPGTPLWHTHARYNLNCTINEMGLPETTGYAYDVKKLRPRPKCILETEANLMRILAADAMHECGALSTTMSAISTVIIKSDELAAETAEWLHRILAVGGMVLQVYQSMKRELRERQIQRDQCTMDAHLISARYYLQLERRHTNAGHNRYVIVNPIVDLYRKHKPSKVSITSVDGDSPMLAWLRSTPRSCEFCDVSPALLRSPEFEHLSRALDANPACLPLQQMPIPPRLWCSGRWLKYSVSCRSLNRLEVDCKGTVRVCRFSKPIGKVGNTKEYLLGSLSELVREVEKRRGCRGCDEAECPRCPFPGCDDQTYCSTIKQCAPILRTLMLIHVYSRLPTRLILRRDLAVAE